MLRVFPLFAALLFVEASYAQTAELGWSYPSAEPLRVHIVRGSAYYDRDYRIEEVLAHAGVNLFTESTQADRGTSEYGDTSSTETGWLWRHADPSGHVMDHHLVVVSNISAKSFGKNQQVLVDFVKHGGSVLFLCGSSSFGDQSAKSAFAEMAPLDFSADGPWKLETEQVSEGMELKPGLDFGADRLPGVEPDKPLRVYSCYEVKPKEGAKVLLVAGDNKPVLIVHKFGKGRVAVFAATCRGYPKEGQIAYWRWDGWPALLAETVRELAAAPGDIPHGLDDGSRRAVIEAREKAFDLLDGVDETRRKQFEAALHQTAKRCHDKATADFLLGQAAKYPLGLPNELAGTIGQAVCPWVDEGNVKHSRALIDSGDVGKTVLALVVLGATRAGDARSTLEEFYLTGEPRKKAGSDFSLATADPGTVGAYMQASEEAEQIRRAAIMGLGRLGDRAAVPVLRGIAARYAVKGRYDPDRESEAIESEHRNYQNAMIASLLCGDAEAAGPVVDFVLENLSVIPRIDPETGDRRAATIWQQQLYRRLATVPDSVLPALAKRIGPEDSRGVMTAALAAFGGKDLSSEIATALSESPIAAVAALGERHLQK
jgi:hypothetical protein